jgi:HPt (histidine-containing phosphotransfer) domain-containing protein
MMVDLELDELKREFLAEAAEKVREMLEKVDDSSDAGRERLTYLAHQLKGSGGSYGFQRISDEATGLEKALENGRNEERIQQYVVNLRSEIERRLRELS